MAKRKEYITMKPVDVTAYKGSVASKKTLPAQSFVVPIEVCYIPKHVIVREYKMSSEIYVYCHYGIVLISKDVIREI